MLSISYRLGYSQHQEKRMQCSEVSGPVNMQMRGANENTRGSRINDEFIRVGGYDDEDEKERMTRPRRSYVEAGVRVKVERAIKVTSVAYLPVILSVVFCDFMHDFNPPKCCVQEIRSIRMSL